MKCSQSPEVVSSKAWVLKKATSTLAQLWMRAFLVSMRLPAAIHVLSVVRSVDSVWSLDSLDAAMRRSL